MSQETAARADGVAKRGLPLRRFLAGVGTTMAVAGCVGDNSGSSGEGTNERTDDTGGEPSGEDVGEKYSGGEALADDCAGLVGV